MSQFLYCARCNKNMAELRDAKIRNGIVVYCKLCAVVIEVALIESDRKSWAHSDIPDFFKEFLR